MSNWSCDQKVCAACRYWCGRRKIDSWASFFEALDEKGECAGPQGSFRGADMYDSSSCSEWESFRNK